MRNTLILMAVLSSAPMLGQEPVFQLASIRSDTVKRGKMIAEVRGIGMVQDRRTVMLHVAETMVKDVRVGQQVSINIIDIGKEKALVGRVSKVDPSILNGTVPVIVSLRPTLPLHLAAGLSVDGTIVVGSLDAIYVARPEFANAESEGTLFRIDADDHHATRVRVLFGRSSASTIEIREGLRPGDRVILSDMRSLEGQSRIRLQ